MLQDKFCKKCGEEYTDIRQEWCKPCQIDNLKGNITNWTSENEKIDNFIQETQLKINQYDDIVFEWILDMGPETSARISESFGFRNIRIETFPETRN